MRIAKTVELGEVCKVVMGQSPPSSSYNTTKNGLPFFQGKTDFGDLYPTARFFCNEPTRVANGGDVLISVRAPVGPTNLAREQCCIGRGLSAIQAQENIDPIYLLFFLRYFEPQLARLGQGSTFEAVNRDDLETLKIPLPELSEQQRIASMLERADSLRRTRRYVLELSDSFLPAAFIELFGDLNKNPHTFEITPAGELFHIQLGKMLDAKRFTGEHLRPYLGNSNVQWGRFDLDDLKEMDFSPKDFERFKLHPGDILVCEGGEVGRAAIWNGEIKNCCYQKALHRLRPKDERILPVYFLHFMRAVVDGGLLAKHTTSSTISHFTAEKFEELPVLVPPLDLQRHFSNLVERHEHLHATQREALRQAEHLFQTLLHKAFTVEQ